MAKKVKNDPVVAMLHEIERKITAKAYSEAALHFGDGSIPYAEIVAGILLRASSQVAMNGDRAKWWIDQYTALAEHIRDHHLAAAPASPATAEAAAD